MAKQKSPRLFRLVQGSYQDTLPVLGDDGKQQKNEAGQPMFETKTWTAPPGAYLPGRENTGPIVESEQDLVKKFGPEKFRYLEEGGSYEISKTREEQAAEERDHIAEMRANQPAAAGQPTQPIPATTAGPRPEGGWEGQPGAQPGAAQGQDDLEEKTVDELKELADSEEVEYTSNVRKQELIDSIRESRKGK